MNHVNHQFVVYTFILNIDTDKWYPTYATSFVYTHYSGSPWMRILFQHLPMLDIIYTPKKYASSYNEWHPMAYQTKPNNAKNATLSKALNSNHARYAIETNTNTIKYTLKAHLLIQPLPTQNTLQNSCTQSLHCSSNLLLSHATRYSFLVTDPHSRSKNLSSRSPLSSHTR